MIDLNILSSPEHSLSIFKAVTEIYNETHKPKSKYGLNDVEVLAAMALKGHPKINDIVPVVSRMIRSQMFGITVLGPHMGQALMDANMDKDEAIFALAYLASALTYTDTEGVRRGSTPITKRDFIRLTTAAWELMQVHGRNVERTEGQIGQKDN